MVERLLWEGVLPRRISIGSSTRAAYTALAGQLRRSHESWMAWNVESAKGCLSLAPAGGGRPVSKIDLMEVVFPPAKRNAVVAGGVSFFTVSSPITSGRFLSVLYREIDQLACEGLVESSGDRFGQVCGDTDAAEGLSNPVKRDVDRILRRFQEKPTSDLMDYVYRRYPWFTVNSKREQHATRPVASLAVYRLVTRGSRLMGF